ncbi:hypothetical protein CHLRE_09g386149v5 [Chlamydomonas reinhardtii]|uniref:Uncharacterized protein n=1 Tax=Chlamydomonas reinhardtii TaxID=3055 RepID=A0A2K3DCD0_CHLRE|nr:uncharacterized protein CHLRE_09g386149v5 [Chlamydomonas reinhardtii]XP_042920681.1 uncharacterized protein CHLRE_09g386149v5 [Chlamydomonas reinhardtii]PNW78190.1 hypothetical protein CHLRE_09g386149v5 [Chlamydomonas reinhardtii]PNW78191.1 hypothetical protein CHLRE_09g386149v5 [Chlamydomonas reinhardtii]
MRVISSSMNHRPVVSGNARCGRYLAPSLSHSAWPGPPELLDLNRRGHGRGLQPEGGYWERRPAHRLLVIGRGALLWAGQRQAPRL